MAGVQNWSAKVIQLLPFKGAVSVWFTCAYKHSHTHTHRQAHTPLGHMCFLYSCGEGQKKKKRERNVRLQNGGWGVMVLGQEWQLWNEGVSQSATLHTHTCVWGAMGGGTAVGGWGGLKAARLPGGGKWLLFVLVCSVAMQHETRSNFRNKSAS